MKIVREASSLGVKPGQVSATITFDNRDWTLVRTVREQGDVVAWVYRPIDRCAPGAHDEFHLLND